MPSQPRPVPEHQHRRVPRYPEPALLWEKQALLTPESFVSARGVPTKPPYSYPQLIERAILGSPAGQLTLSEIYKWISERYPLYKSSDIDWQSNIRCTLSVNRAFVKEERLAGDRGLGCYLLENTDIRSGPYVLGYMSPMSVDT
jgi:hypothetical protein